MLIFRGVILFLCMSFLAPSVWAVSGFLRVTVSGSVESRPCKINDGKPIEVNFNDVMTTRIENENYKHVGHSHHSRVSQLKPTKKIKMLPSFAYEYC